MLHGVFGHIALFIGSLVLSIVASAVLAHRIDQVGVTLKLSEGMLGIVTALGADAPEISAAITALFSGQHDLGMGVIFGSNIYNLAALLGLSAVIAGRVKVRRRGLALDAGVAFWATLVVAAQALQLLSSTVAGALLALALAPYLAFSLLGPERVGRLPLPASTSAWLARALGGSEENRRKDQMPREASSMDKLAIAPLLAAVVLSSIGLVRSASSLGKEWGISETIIGTLVLAALTGIPNLVAAVRLARHGRGSAVASESFTSNTINLLVGGFMPIALIGFGRLSREGLLSIFWLIGMTAITAILCYVQKGLNRWSGGALVALYLAFMLLTLVWA